MRRWGGCFTSAFPSMEETKDLTENEEFQPTPAMRVWLDTAIQLASDSPTEIETESKITRQSWYEWLKVPGFEDWYYDRYKHLRKRWLPTLDSIGMKNAKRDYNYWKDMKKAAGEEEKGTTVAVQVNNIITQKKDDYGI